MSSSSGIMTSKENAEASRESTPNKRKFDESMRGLVETEEVTYKSGKRNFNVAFFGHVARSTISGKIMYLGNLIAEDDIQECIQDATKRNTPDRWLAYIMDTMEAERDQGNTMKIGRASFETDIVRYTIFDCPGHRGYTAEMVAGLHQADKFVIVISAVEGEFEDGFQTGGLTRELLVVLRCIRHVLVVVNKMDHPTVNWSRVRFDEIKSRVLSMVPALGVSFVPTSGVLGLNIQARVDMNVCPWWNGSCLYEAIDDIKYPIPSGYSPLRMAIIDKYEDEENRTALIGRIKSSSIREGDMLIVMPNKVQVEIMSIYCGIEEERALGAGPGENVLVKVSEIREKDISVGSALCDINSGIQAITKFGAYLIILESFGNGIFCAGYKAVLNIHAIEVECELTKLIANPLMKFAYGIENGYPRFAKHGTRVFCNIEVNNLICFDAGGMVTLRKYGNILAVGHLFIDQQQV